MVLTWPEAGPVARGEVRLARRRRWSRGAAAPRSGGRMTTKAEREAYLARVDKWRATGVAPAEIARRVAEMPREVCFKSVGALTADEAAALEQIWHGRFAQRAARLRRAGVDLAAWLVSLPRRQQPYAERVLTADEQAALAAERARRQAATPQKATVGTAKGAAKPPVSAPPALAAVASPTAQRPILKLRNPLRRQADSP